MNFIKVNTYEELHSCCFIDDFNSDMGFLDTVDGYLYLFFDKDEKDLSAVTLLAEFS